MNEKTVSYLEGRFGDYYRSKEISLPPEYESREWGYIPWTQSPGDRMVRHLSYLNMGEDIHDFLSRKRPQHMYFSATKYKQPGASTMDDKDWKSSDLVFDLDADPQHMDIIDPEEDTYKDMLEKCKQPLQNLLDILQNDFDFSDITVAFSGGRGYHVHVRDDTVQQLGRQERSEIVNYVYARGLDLEIGNQPNHISNPSLVYRTRNGWYKKVYAAMCDLISKIEKETDVETKKEILQEYGLTEKEAKASLQDIESNKSRIRAGNLTTTNDSNLQTVIEALAESIIETHRAEVDEPVTTDINRLIRLPSSLHGGTGLKVTELAPDEVDEFEPLTDAIPEKFKEFEIQVKVLEDVTVELNGEQNEYTEGITTVPEFIGIYLMADGVAEKTSE